MNSFIIGLCIYILIVLIDSVWLIKTEKGRTSTGMCILLAVIPPMTLILLIVIVFKIVSTTLIYLVNFLAGVKNG